MTNGDRRGVTWLAAALIACGCGSQMDEGQAPTASTDGGDGSPAGGAGAADASDGTAGAGGGGGFALDDSEPPEPKVFGHSQTTLYRLNPVSKSLTEVGEFDCVRGGGNNLFGFGMADIALDREGNIVGVGAVADGLPGLVPPQGLVAIDVDTAGCSVIAEIGNLVVTGLTWVPAGVIEPDVEVLVGIVRSQLTQTKYVRFDTTSGAVTDLGDFGGSWFATSADMVSIEADRTYATAYPSFSPEHLLVIEPTTGTVVDDLGDLGLNGVTGMGYWGGIVYLFMHSGKLFEVDAIHGSSQPLEVPIPGAPLGLQFWGAGVGTDAPPALPK